MKQQYFKSSLPNNEQGVFLVYAVLFLVAFIGVVGIAVDLGQLYRAQLQVQRAIDAGVAAATPLILNSGVTREQVAALAREVALDNLAANGLDTAHYTINNATWIDPDPSQKTVLQLTGHANLPLLLLNILPDMAKTNQINARAVGGSKELLVVFVVDLSFSMIDFSNRLQSWMNNAQETVVACNSGAIATDMTTTPGVPTKLEALKEGLKRYIATLSPLDHYGIVTYSSRAYVSSEGELQAASAARLTNIENEINAWPAYNGTNTQEGLYTARMMLSEGNVIGKLGWSSSRYSAASKAVVLITDGAPTIFCLNRTGALPAAPVGGYNFTRPPSTCASEFTFNSAYPGDTTHSGNNKKPSHTDPCQYFETFIANSTTLPVEGPDEDGFRARNFDRTIMEADAVRNNSGKNDVTLYTIGIGQLALGPPLGPALTNVPPYANRTERDDAYQREHRGPNNYDLGLKSNFLRRVANVSSPDGVEPGTMNYWNTPATARNPSLYFGMSGRGVDNVCEFSDGSSVICGVDVLTDALYNSPAHPRGLYLPVRPGNLTDLEQALFATGLSMRGRMIQ